METRHRCTVCEAKLTHPSDIEQGYCLRCNLQVMMDLREWMEVYGGY